MNITLYSSFLSSRIVFVSSLFLYMFCKKILMVLVFIDFYHLWYYNMAKMAKSLFIFFSFLFQLIK